MKHGPSWRQINITYPGPGWQDRERQAISHLAGILPEAETSGLISSWWFIRKGAWRIRYCLAQDTASPDPLRPLLTDGQAWTRDIYEPETYAFGGPASMDTAHTLFCNDTRHLLTYLSSNPAGRREHSLVLCTALMRAAALDIHEQGDVWARIAEQRADATVPEHQPTPEQSAMLTSGTRRLILGTPRPGTIPGTWLAAFETAGTDLRTLRENGQITRGIRAITALHVIFHWNRIGLPASTQKILASAAKDASFASGHETGPPA